MTFSSSPRPSSVPLAAAAEVLSKGRLSAGESTEKGSVSWRFHKVGENEGQCFANYIPIESPLVTPAANVSEVFMLLLPRVSLLVALV